VPDSAAKPARTGLSPVWDAVAALPDKQRFAVAYHYLAGLPYARIAELLGNSEAAARRAAADGIRTLRRTMDVADAALAMEDA
jgi:DNA-directed RNA polymerase specialized sigma24 family protein